MYTLPQGRFRVSKAKKPAGRPYKIVDKKYEDDMVRTVTKYKPKGLVKSPGTKYPPMYYRPSSPVRKIYKKRPLNAMTRPSASGAMTTSSYVIGSARKSKFMYNVFKQNCKNIMTSISSARIESVYGKQSVHVIHSNTATTYQQAVDYTTSATVVVAERRRQSYFFGKTSLETTLTNQDICTAFVDIYELQPRFNMSGSENPIALWERGIGDQAQVSNAVSKDYVNEIGAKPFESKAFCIYFLVKHIRRVELMPGAIHKHVSIINVNKKIQGEIAAAFQYAKGFAHHTMFITGGTPINDMTIKGNVSTSSTTIDMVHRHVVEFAYVLDNSTNTYRVNTLPTVTTGASLSDLTVTSDTSA